MIVYRITPKIYSHSLHAPGLPGRWNGAGRKVIYTAEGIALAFMENMIRRKGLGFNDQFAIMFIRVPDDLKITAINPVSLAEGWRSYNDYRICQSVGNEWFDKGATAILKVPSAILPGEFNYVLNATHREFSRIRVVGTSPVIPDERIEDLLKKYPVKTKGTRKGD